MKFHPPSPALLKTWHRPNFFALLMVSLSTNASVAAASASAPAADIVQLSPFTVNTDRDTGYRAADSLTGGRIELPLDRTPAAVSVLTRDFLDDIAASSFTTAATWTTNAFLQSNGTSNFSEFQVNFRGVGSGLQTINYFTFQNQSDGYNTERLEFTRGPNSILFGNGNLSGIPTTFTKQPRFRDFTQVQMRGDSFGGVRATLDVNRQLLGGRAAVRLNLVGQRDPGWHPMRRNDRQGAHLAAIVKVGDSAAIRLEAEYGKTQRHWSDQNFFDSLSGWDGRTVYTGTGSTTASTVGTGLTFVAGNATRDYYLYDPSQPALGVQNLRGFYGTTGQTSLTLMPASTRGYVANFPSIPHKGFNVNPANDLVLNQYEITTIYFEKQFGPDLFLQLALNHNQYDRTAKGNNWIVARVDINQFLPGGAPNTKFGQLYADAQPTNQRQWDPEQDARLLGSYRLATSWFEQRFSLLLSERRGTFFLTNEKLVRTNNPAVPSFNDQGNFIYQRFYFNRDAKYTFAEADATSNGVTAAMFRDNYQAFPGRTRVAQLATVGSYFRNTLSTVLGLRRDAVKRNTIASAVNADNTLRLTEAPQTFAATTGSAGFVWFPVRWVGPFANYSESYSGSALGNPLFDGTQPAPTSGRSKEVGVQIKLFGEKLQGRISYYDTLETGRVINTVNVANINTMWTTLGLGSRALGVTPRDTQTLNARGLEVDLTANLTRNWRTFFNFAVPETFQNSSLPSEKAYVAANLATWQAGTTDQTLTPAARTTITTNLTTLNNGLQGTNDGRANNATMKYRGNAYSTYTFTNDALKGFAIGGGGQLYGPQIIGNVAGQPFNYLFMRSRVLAAAHLSYAGVHGKIRYRVQLNATNLLNDTRLLYNSIARPAGLSYDVHNGFNYIEPRRLILSTTFDF